MADDNALRAGQLPAPVVLNPLAAMSSAAQTAGNIYSLREKQAQEAVGNILQQATDANGNVDYSRAQALAAQAGPVVQMGMQTMLRENSALQNQQTANAANRMKFVATSAITVARDPSDANVNAAFDNLAAHGVPAGQVASERARWLAMSPEQRQDEAVRHGMLALDQLHQTVGQTQLTTFGGTTAPTTVVQPTARQPGSLAVGPGVAHSVAPGDMVTVKRWENPDGTPAQPGAPGASEVTREVHKSAVPGVPQGPPVVAPTGGGAGSSAPPIPPPADAPNVSIPGKYQPRQGATPAAPTAPATTPTPATPASPFGTGAFGGASTVAPAPTAPTAPATPPAATPPAATPAPGLVVSTSVPSGVTQEQNLSATQWAADRAEAGNFQQRIWPMVQSYALLTGGDLTTGKGAEAVNTVKGYLQTLGSIFTPADLQSIRQAKWEELGKYLQQAVNSNPFAGGSNDKLAAAISGNPNTHISTLANTDVVKSMIALERAKQAAVTEFQNSGQPASSWADFKAKWQTGHDVRVFATDMMKDEEVKAMLTKMSPAELASYQKTLDLIKANPSIMNTAPMPHAQATPAAAPTRALAMAQPQGNPLLAYA